MANITTSLPIIIEENNRLQEYTKEKKVLSSSIKASPLMNYLPLDYYMAGKNCRTSYINNTLTKVGKHFHMDFNNIDYIRGASIFLIDLTNIIDLEIGQTYTFSFVVSNVEGTYDPASFNYNWVLVKNNTDYGGQYISSWYPKNGFYSFTFIPKNTVSYIVWGRNCYYITTKDLSFDIELVGLVKGTEAIQRSYNSFFMHPSISVSNTNNVLGEYQISRDVRRHIKQIERNIQKQENTFNISWR